MITEKVIFSTFVQQKVLRVVTSSRATTADSHDYRRSDNMQYVEDKYSRKFRE